MKINKKLNYECIEFIESIKKFLENEKVLKSNIKDLKKTITSLKLSNASAKRHAEFLKSYRLKDRDRIDELLKEVKLLQIENEMLNSNENIELINQRNNLINEKNYENSKLECPSLLDIYKIKNT